MNATTWSPCVGAACYAKEDSRRFAGEILARVDVSRWRVKIYVEERGWDEKPIKRTVERTFHRSQLESRSE